jgi:acyl CoA:acetate/3-ketoacid CoA transferase beta subunit
MIRGGHPDSIMLGALSSFQRRGTLGYWTAFKVAGAGIGGSTDIAVGAKGKSSAFETFG